MELGNDYNMGLLSPGQTQMIKHLRDFGVIYQRKV